MKKLILLALAIMVFSGCSILTPQETICDDVGPSVICQATAKMGTTPEGAGNMLIIANASLIRAGKYTAEDALYMMELLRKQLEKPVSYYFIKRVVYSGIEAYPELFITANIILKDFSNTQIMYNADRAMLRDWLDGQIAIYRELK
jgi:hypothetical protein